MGRLMGSWWRSAVLVLAALELGACAKVYVPPVSGSLARVRVAAEYYGGSRRVSYMPPVIAANEGCTAGAQIPLQYYSSVDIDETAPEKADAVAEFRRKAFPLGIPDAPKRLTGQKWGEMRVPAGRPVAFTFSFGSSERMGTLTTYSNCSVTGFFQFDPDGDYEVTFHTQGGQGRQSGCVVKAERIFSFAGDIARIPVPVLSACR